MSTLSTLSIVSSVRLLTRLLTRLLSGLLPRWLSRWLSRLISWRHLAHLSSFFCNYLFFCLKHLSSTCSLCLFLRIFFSTACSRWYPYPSTLSYLLYRCQEVPWKRIKRWDQDKYRAEDQAFSGNLLHKFTFTLKGGESSCSSTCDGLEFPEDPRIEKTCNQL